MESRPAFSGSVSENISPMSPSAAAPRMASVTACATASPSEWPCRCTPKGMRTPPSTSGPPGSKRCESYPMPVRIGEWRSHRTSACGYEPRHSVNPGSA